MAVVTRDEWRKCIGRRSEAVAARFLQSQGFSIRDRNFLVRQGELDLVVERGRQLAIVEVRSATTSYLRCPGETVTRRKQLRVIRATEAYLRRFGLQERDVRFDVIAVRWVKGEAHLEWFQDAFRPESTATATRFR